MTPKQLELFKTVMERSIAEDVVLMQEKENIQTRIAATIADATDVQHFLRSLCEVRQVLSCLPMKPAQCPEGLTPATLIVQSAKDLCRESLVINGEVFTGHCMSEVDRGASVLKQKLLLDVFEKGFQPAHLAAAQRKRPHRLQHRGDNTKRTNDAEASAADELEQQLSEFHEHKRECVDRIIKAACRTISGGDSFDEVLSLFVSTHFLITPYVPMAK
jgi:hypothetical protein